MIGPVYSRMEQKLDLILQSEYSFRYRLVPPQQVKCASPPAMIFDIIPLLPVAPFSSGDPPGP